MDNHSPKDRWFSHLPYVDDVYNAFWCKGRKNKNKKLIRSINIHMMFSSCFYITAKFIVHSKDWGRLRSQCKIQNTSSSVTSSHSIIHQILARLTCIQLCWLHQNSLRYTDCSLMQIMTNVSQNTELFIYTLHGMFKNCWTAYSICC